jgi:tRNA (guanine37-N1)-methyltransferase
MDERVMELADECLSLGDFVLTGGELCALAVTDAVVRLVPGALGHDMSAVEESFYDDLLEHAQYTRPADFEGRTVPEVLLSGDHAAIARWKRRNAVERTARLRPDLIEKANLSEDERVLAMRIINTMTQEEA